MNQTKLTLLLTCLLITGCCSDRNNPILSNRDLGVNYYSGMKYYPGPLRAYNKIDTGQLGEYRAFYMITYNMDALPETVEKRLDDKVIWKHEYFYENGRLARYRAMAGQEISEKEIRYNGCKAIY
ncbi:MAG: hypothetical protein GXY41_10475 [Phycisphaerae bacterium]|nr:hypothetical protein [Phycisphaerae bacterium]